MGVALKTFRLLYPEVLIHYARLYDVSRSEEHNLSGVQGLAKPDKCEFHFSCSLYSVILNKSFAVFY